jgi:hypothetical protein
VADVPAFLGSVDVAVLPSHSEGMSNALLEYMAAGRAIVATAVGANRDLIRHGVEGLVVPPGDDGVLAGAIGEQVADPARARRMGRSARDRVEIEYSRDAMRRRFENFYRELATGQADTAIASDGGRASVTTSGQAEQATGPDCPNQRHRDRIEQAGREAASVGPR